MSKLLIFSVLSIVVFYISWRSLKSSKSHGFYRFFGWVGICWLIADNYSFWFVDPLKTTQLISWGLLLISMYLIISGGIRLIWTGKPSSHRQDDTLFSFEKTTGLIDIGVYKYIRHPLYASLIYLTWGICMKNPTLLNISVSVLSSIFLYITSKKDEKECLVYFGESYSEYMKRSKMFIPFIF